MSYTHDSKRLMSKRIHEVLLVSSPYDLYIMEEEGLLADRISDEYSLFHLTNAPVITQVSTAEEALLAIKTKHFDLVITGMRVGRSFNAFEMAKNIKEKSPNLPVILITSETWRLPTLSKRLEEGLVDKIFYWHGDTRLFLAIIKIFEDKFNATHDCIEEQVRAIILVEDSPHFYSAYLPLIYTEIMEQTRALIAEGTSDEEKLLHMAARPKILMAENYEEAVALYAKFRTNVLGVISDIRFPKDGKLDPEAGFAFTELVKKDNSDVPVLLQSQDTVNAYRASNLGAAFVDKNSPHLLHNLRNFILTYFGFGDFVFRLPDGREVGRARTLREMEDVLLWIPQESIEYHSRRNHFSNWLFARGEFGLAARLRPMRIHDFLSIEELRQTIRKGLRTTRLTKRSSRIVNFSRSDYDLSAPFIRFGGGSIGGKGRGIAFMSKLLADPLIAPKFDNLKITIPQTAAIGTDVFDHFIEGNKLHKVAIESNDDAFIAKNFLEANLDEAVTSELATFLHRFERPLAVRSSSLSEDSLSQPFAGLYQTYFLPNNQKNFDERLKQLLAAIKLIYASTFFSNPKAYMKANNIAFEGEKMAILIQQIVGRRHGNSYHPDMAGVAQSYNYFPVGYLKPEDGVAQVVMGLGTMAVRGGNSIRFSPKYPGIMPQFARTRDVIANSQREFHALNLSRSQDLLTMDENSTLITLPISDAEEHGLLGKLGGVYSDEDDIIYDGLHRKGKRILTFKSIIDESLYPLPRILSRILEIGSAGMGCAVEIEFAANLPAKDDPAEFVFLQLRPLVSCEAEDEIVVGKEDRTKSLAISNRAMGNGIFNSLIDIIYVKEEAFDISRTPEIAAEIGRFNSKMVAEGHQYILMGFGRWGTVNSKLGIPVAYAQVSNAKVLIEISTPEINVEPSQGTHFFHNIASSRIGYLAINTGNENDFIDWKWLNEQQPLEEGEFIRHIRLSSPSIVRIDGRSGNGVVLKTT